MKIDVIDTGSSGNGFLIDDEILIDAGLPYSKLSKYSIEVVLLTHIHGDHFRADTIRKLYVNNEDTVFVCGEFLFEHLHKVGIPKRNIFVVLPNRVYGLEDYLVSAVELFHDVPNFGWRIIKNGHKHFHATDTAHLDGIEAKDYDTATIECNHDENKAIFIIEEAKKNGEFTHLKGAMNSHLSVQQALEFVEKNNIKKLIPVHIGNSTKDAVLKILKNAEVVYAK